MSPGEPGPSGRAGLLPRGATLGRYVVLDPIGSGGMGVVYAAYDFGLNRKVALKLVRGDVNPAARDARRMRLLEEAQAVARLTHPNVIAVHDVGTWGEEPFIAMEHVDGGTLEEWLAAKPRPTLRQILDVFLQAGRGLAAAHRAGLVHRDFKPQNVLVGADGRVRVTDFGLARRVPEAGGPAPSGARGSGTPAYMAPEQVAGHGGSALADQYSFSVTLYEAVYGQRPALPAPPHGARVPPWLRKVLLRGLSTDPSHRFPSMEALLSALAGGGERAARVAGAVLAPAAAAALLALASWPGGAPTAPPLLPAAPETACVQAPPERARFPVPVLAATPAPSQPLASTLPAAWSPRDDDPGLVVPSPQWAHFEVNHVTDDLPPASPPSASPPPSSEDPLLLALQRLARALRDLGLIDDQLALKHPTVARWLAPALDDPEESESLDAVVWAPVPWSPGAPPRSLFTTFTVPDPPALDQAHNPVEAAEMKFSYAQTIWDRDRERALLLAREAEQTLLTSHDAPPDLLEQVQAWIDAKLNPEP